MLGCVRSEEEEVRWLDVRCFSLLVFLLRLVFSNWIIFPTRFPAAFSVHRLNHIYFEERMRYI